MASLFCFALATGLPIRARRAAVTTRRPQWCRVRASQTPPPPGRDGEYEGANKEENTDWDRSWQDYQTTSADKGGVFGITEGERSESQRDKSETRLAEAWTSERAFLVAATALLLVGVIYASVLLSGGIN